MPAIYLTNVTGTGTRRDPNTFAITANGTVMALMIDERATRRKAVVWSDDVNATGSGVMLIAQGATQADLLQALTSTFLPSNQRALVNAWLAAAKYTALPASALSLFDVIVAICAQVNPALDLAAFLSS